MFAVHEIERGPRGARSDRQQPATATHLPPLARAFFVVGARPQKLRRGGERPKNTANHLAQGLQRILTFHPQSTHTLSTDARLAKTPIPHYLVSRSQRTTRYRGSCKITHKSQPARSSDLRGGTSSDFSSQTAPAEATEASPPRALFGHGCCRPAWHSSATVFGPSPEPLTSARERQAIAPYS